MTPDEAVQIARAFIDTAFELETVREVEVEELRLDERTGAWTITFVFARTIDGRSAVSDGRRSRRTVSLSDSDGALLALRRREPLAAAG